MGFSDFTDEFETLGKSTVRQIKQMPKQAAKTAISQLNGSTNQNPANNTQAPTDSASGGHSAADQQQMLEQMYGKADPPAQKVQNQPQNQQALGKQQTVTTMIVGDKKLTPEELQRLEKVRQEIGQKQHYEMHFKQLEELGKTKQQEPSVEEKKEVEEQEKKQKESLEIQKKQKTQEDLAVANARKGTGEQLKGVGG